MRHKLFRHLPNRQRTGIRAAARALREAEADGDDATAAAATAYIDRRTDEAIDRKHFGKEDD